MTRILCLVYCPENKFVGAHREGQAWGRLEAELVDGEWVGVDPFEIIAVDVDLDNPPAEVQLECHDGGTIAVPWDELEAHI